MSQHFERPGDSSEGGKVQDVTCLSTILDFARDRVSEHLTLHANNLFVVFKVLSHQRLFIQDPRLNGNLSRSLCALFILPTGYHDNIYASLFALRNCILDSRLQLGITVD